MFTQQLLLWYRAFIIHPSLHVSYINSGFLETTACIKTKYYEKLTYPPYVPILLFFFQNFDFSKLYKVCFVFWKFQNSISPSFDPFQPNFMINMVLLGSILGFNITFLVIYQIKRYMYGIFRMNHLSYNLPLSINLNRQGVIEWSNLPGYLTAVYNVPVITNQY